MIFWITFNTHIENLWVHPMNHNEQQPSIRFMVTVQKYDHKHNKHNCSQSYTLTPSVRVCVCLRVCAKILLSLIDWIDTSKSKNPLNSANGERNESMQLFVDIIQKALQVAELILRDDKYRLKVRLTRSLIHSFAR